MDSRIPPVIAVSKWLMLLCAVAACAAVPLQGRCADNGPAENKIVRTITVVVGDIFEEDRPEWLFRQVNDWKFSTKEQVVRQELLFAEGDTINNFILAESLRNLRSVGFLRRASISTQVDGDYVDVTIYVQDTWTLVPLIDLTSGTGRNQQTLGIKDPNILGCGKSALFKYEEDDNLEFWEVSWDDSRLWGTNKRFGTGYLDSNDGKSWLAYVDKPYRTLLDDHAWALNAFQSDVIGRLYANGSESFIFQQREDLFHGSWSWSKGDPERRLQRTYLGYRYSRAAFAEVDLSDYRRLDLDPDALLRDPALVPADRTLSGPEFTWQSLRRRYLSSEQIDRFTRIQDIDLGTETAFTVQAAPSAFGSLEDSLPFSFHYRDGNRPIPQAFVRWEAGAGGRVEGDGWQNTLLRAEAKAYWLLGKGSLVGLDIPANTWAGSFLLDYGTELDGDRQLTLGGDNFLRGYKARAMVGDKRVALNIENRLHLFQNVLKLFHIGTAAFIDIGGATYDDFGKLLANDIYSDIGLGLRIGLLRSSSEQIVRIDVAFPLRDGPDGSMQFEPRLTLSGGQFFDAALRSESWGANGATKAIGQTR